MLKDNQESKQDKIKDKMHDEIKNKLSNIFKKSDGAGVRSGQASSNPFAAFMQKNKPQNVQSVAGENKINQDKLQMFLQNAKKIAEQGKSGQEVQKQAYDKKINQDKLQLFL